MFDEVAKIKRRQGDVRHSNLDMCIFRITVIVIILCLFLAISWNYIFPITSTRTVQAECGVIRLYGDGSVKVGYNGNGYIAKKEYVHINNLSVGDNVSCEITISNREHIHNKINIVDIKEVSR